MPFSEIAPLISEHLTKKRKQLKLTQQQVADRSGIPRTNIARLETNLAYQATFDTLEKWANAVEEEVILSFEPLFVDGEK